MSDIIPETITAEIEQLERKLLEDKKKLAELRHQLEPTPVDDYTFHNHSGKEVNLSQLFGAKDDLIVIHNMGKRCSYCTMWADGFNGVKHHLENRAAFVVVSPDEYKVQREFANSRGWEFKMMSAFGTSFFKDMGFENDEGSPWPGVSTFRRQLDGSIVRVAHTYFGPGDDFCSPWHLLDLLLKGADGWEPKFVYEGVSLAKPKSAMKAKSAAKAKSKPAPKPKAKPKAKVMAKAKPKSKPKSKLAKPKSKSKPAAKRRR
jgi:predicted dithiol-disulfide oxidoreductase (DUF899 family)